MPDEIVVEGAPVLREAAKEVPKKMFGTKELADMVSRMSASLRATSNGVAIAAPQIAIPYRIFVVSGFVVTGGERNLEDPDVAFINPKILKLSHEKETLEEGCLSVPGLYGKIVRSSKAKVRAYTPEGKKFERGSGGLMAQIFQHEIDHLNGILFIDNAYDLARPEHPVPAEKRNKKE
ncbi:MAG: peptide deformylase [Patescibacteria group bacterium]